MTVRESDENRKEIKINETRFALKNKTKKTKVKGSKGEKQRKRNKRNG
jgi:hypothetical protein